MISPIGRLAANQKEKATKRITPLWLRVTYWLCRDQHAR